MRDEQIYVFLIAYKSNSTISFQNLIQSEN